MTGDDPYPVSIRCSDFILGGVATEEGETGVGLFMNMAPHEPEGIRFAGHDTYIDASLVVAFDDHDVFVALSTHLCQDMVIELTQCPAIFHLHQCDDVCIDVPDHPGCILDGDGIDGFLFQFDPADPAFTSFGNDLHRFTGLPFEEFTADGTKGGVFVAISF